MEEKRYYRQIIIPEIGSDGQKKLLDGKVLIVGVGGLGSPVALYLTAAGIGTLGLVDKDIVEVSNLQRQILHSTSRLGIPKVLSGEGVLKDLNPHTTVKTYTGEITRENVLQYIAGYDVVVAAVDNFQTRFILNEACIKTGIPLVEGGVYNWDGTVHTIIKGEGPCYSCLYSESSRKLATPGVIGPIVGIVGSWQAMEVIKYLLGTGHLLTDRMLFIDGLKASVAEFKLSIKEDCPICR